MHVALVPIRTVSCARIVRSSIAIQTRLPAKLLMSQLSCDGSASGARSQNMTGALTSLQSLFRKLTAFTMWHSPMPRYWLRASP